jgi:hypothetical protein
LDKPRVAEPGTETKEIPPELDRALVKTKLFAVGSDTVIPDPVDVEILTVDKEVERAASCAVVANRKLPGEEAVCRGSKDI